MKNDRKKQIHVYTLYNMFVIKSSAGKWDSNK